MDISYIFLPSCSIFFLCQVISSSALTVAKAEVAEFLSEGAISVVQTKRKLLGEVYNQTCMIMCPLIVRCLVVNPLRGRLLKL